MEKKDMHQVSKTMRDENSPVLSPAKETKIIRMNRISGCLKRDILSKNEPTNLSLLGTNLEKDSTITNFEKESTITSDRSSEKADSGNNVLNLPYLDGPDLAECLTDSYHSTEQAVLREYNLLFDELFPEKCEEVELQDLGRESFNLEQILSDNYGGNHCGTLRYRTPPDSENVTLIGTLSDFFLSLSGSPEETGLKCDSAKTLLPTNAVCDDMNRKLTSINTGLFTQTSPVESDFPIKKSSALKCDSAKTLLPTNDADEDIKLKKKLINTGLFTQTSLVESDLPNKKSIALKCDSAKTLLPTNDADDDIKLKKKLKNTGLFTQTSPVESDLPNKNSIVLKCDSAKTLLATNTTDDDINLNKKLINTGMFTQTSHVESDLPNKKSSVLKCDSEKSLLPTNAAVDDIELKNKLINTEMFTQISPVVSDLPKKKSRVFLLRPTKVKHMQKITTQLVYNENVSSQDLIEKTPMEKATIQSQLSSSQISKTKGISSAEPSNIEDDLSYSQFSCDYSEAEIASLLEGSSDVSIVPTSEESLLLGDSIELCNRLSSFRETPDMEITGRKSSDVSNQLLTDEQHEKNEKSPDMEFTGRNVFARGVDATLVKEILENMKRGEQTSSPCTFPSSDVLNQPLTAEQQEQSKESRDNDSTSETTSGGKWENLTTILDRVRNVLDTAVGYLNINKNVHEISKQITNVSESRKNDVTTANVIVQNRNASAQADLLSEIIFTQNSQQYAAISNFHKSLSPLNVAEQSSMPLDGNVEYSMPLDGNVEYSMPLDGNVEYSMPLDGNVEYSMPLDGNVEYSMPLDANEKYSLPSNMTEESSMPLDTDEKYSLQKTEKHQAGSIEYQTSSANVSFSHQSIDINNSLGKYDEKDIKEPPMTTTVDNISAKYSEHQISKSLKELSSKEKYSYLPTSNNALIKQEKNSLLTVPDNKDELQSDSAGSIITDNKKTIDINERPDTYDEKYVEEHPMIVPTKESSVEQHNRISSSTNTLEEQEESDMLINEPEIQDELHLGSTGSILIDHDNILQSKENITVVETIASTLFLSPACQTDDKTTTIPNPDENENVNALLETTNLKRINGMQATPECFKTNSKPKTETPCVWSMISTSDKSPSCQTEEKTLDTAANPNRNDDVKTARKILVATRRFNRFTRSQTTLKCLTTTPKRLETRSKSLATTPKSLETTSKSLKTTTKSLETTPKSLEITPKSWVTTPKSWKTTPKSLETRFKSLKTTPKSLKTTPKSLKTTPKSLETTPKSLETTPKSLETTPKSMETTPKYTTKESHSSPHAKKQKVDETLRLRRSMRLKKKDTCGVSRDENDLTSDEEKPKEHQIDVEDHPLNTPMTRSRRIKRPRSPCDSPYMTRSKLRRLSLMCQPQSIK